MQRPQRAKPLVQLELLGSFAVKCIFVLIYSTLITSIVLAFFDAQLHTVINQYPNKAIFNHSDTFRWNKLMTFSRAELFFTVTASIGYTKPEYVDNVFLGYKVTVASQSNPASFATVERSENVTCILARTYCAPFQLISPEAYAEHVEHTLDWSIDVEFNSTNSSLLRNNDVTISISFNDGISRYADLALRLIMLSVTSACLIGFVWNLWQTSRDEILPEQRWIIILFVGLFLWQDPVWLSWVVLWDWVGFEVYSRVGFAISEGIFSWFWLMMMESVRATHASYHKVSPDDFFDTQPTQHGCRFYIGPTFLCLSITATTIAHEVWESFKVFSSLFVGVEASSYSIADGHSLALDRVASMVVGHHLQCREPSQSTPIFGHSFPTANISLLRLPDMADRGLRCLESAHCRDFK